MVKVDTATTEKKIVRCRSCRALMAGGLLRCPHCGQMTSGNEEVLTEDSLGAEKRERTAKRKEQGQECKECGKKVASGTICKDCSSKHARNTFLLILFGVIVVFLMLMYLLV